MKWKNIWSSGPKATAGAQQTQEIGPWRRQRWSPDAGALKMDTANYSKGASGMDVLNVFADFWNVPWSEFSYTLPKLLPSKCPCTGLVGSCEVHLLASLAEENNWSPEKLDEKPMKPQ